MKMDVVWGAVRRGVGRVVDMGGLLAAPASDRTPEERAEADVQRALAQVAEAFRAAAAAVPERPRPSRPPVAARAGGAVG